MNTARNLLLGAVITLMGITACNYTVGECWPVGQGGGTGSEGVTAGGGVIVPTGPAGSGDYGAPPKQPQDETNPGEIKCNSDEEDEPETATTGTPSACQGGGDTEGAYVVCSDPCPQNDTQCMAGVIRFFSPGDFIFIQIVADDGTGLAGGWQQADVRLYFVHSAWEVEINECRVVIGMPLRTQLLGKISPSIAATYSANSANEVAEEMWPPKVPPGIFCSQFRNALEPRINGKYPGLGATVKLNP